MRIEGDYKRDGYTAIRGLIPPEVAAFLFKQIEIDLAAAGKSFETFAKVHPLSKQQTVDISGHFYRPLTTFLWGLTPIIGELTGADVLPSYDYFRIYQKDDICRVHSDRPSCEHSVSLTLAYSDGVPWPLQVSAPGVWTARARASTISATNPFPRSRCSPATRSSIAESICATAEPSPIPTSGRRTSSCSGLSAAANLRNTPSMSNASDRN